MVPPAIASENRSVRIIGVPLDLGAGRRGVDMGPSALRVAGLQRALEGIGHRVTDQGDIEADLPETAVLGSQRLRFAGAILCMAGKLSNAVRSSIEAGEFPLVLGGDHSLAIGSVSGSASGLAAHKQPLGLIWLDAHADMNTPDTTPSGNIHGMSLAVLLGHGDARLTGLAHPSPAVDPARVAIVGARDLDPGERDLIRRTGIHVFTIREVDELGVPEVMSRAVQTATRGGAGIHLQLDMDVVDPADAPGTGTPIRGGLSYREAHLAMEILADSGALRAMDVVEINPILDERNRTAALAIELILSALGKRIL